MYSSLKKYDSRMFPVKRILMLIINSFTLSMKEIIVPSTNRIIKENQFADDVIIMIIKKR